MTFTEAFHPPDNDDKGSACGVGLEGWLSEGGGKHAVVTVPFTTGFDFNVFMSTCDDIIVYFCGQLVRIYYVTYICALNAKVKFTTN